MSTREGRNRARLTGTALPGTIPAAMLFGDVDRRADPRHAALLQNSVQVHA
jgi:hypothetical protein